MSGFGFGFGFGNGGGAVAQFAPTDIAGLQLWLDANDASTITDVAGVVSQWRDKSGNANHANQSNATYKPSTGVNTLGGKNILTFDQDFLQLTSNLTFREIFIVVDALNGSDLAKNSPLLGSLTPDTSYQTFVQTNSSDASYDISINGSSTYSGTVFHNGGAGYTGTDVNLGLTSAQLSAPSIWDIQFDANSRVDYLASYGTTSHRLKGRIAEVLAFSSVLTTSQQNQVGNYLASKWGT